MGFLIERDFSIHQDLSSGIFPFTGIYLVGFFHSPKFFLSSRGFFHSLWFESLIFIQNSKIFKELVRRFFTLSEKNYQIFMLMSIQRDFSIHRNFFNPHLNPCFSWRNVIPPFKRREEWHICISSKLQYLRSKKEKN